MILLSLFVVQAFVNLIGALGPELAFDALWYHLTLPKLYLDYHSLLHIPGGLLYYSDMPKLGEMFYITAFSFGDEILAKIIHFSFGLFVCLVIYKFSRQYFTQFISLLAALIFYSNLVVAWESTTAYIDLIRAFFEITALWGFIYWYKTRETKWLIESAALVGLAITTKVLALGSLAIFVFLIAFIFLKKKDVKGFLKNAGLFSLISLLVPLPWFVFSYIHTGNPVYPFFTPTYEVSSSIHLLNPLVFFAEVWNVFTRSQDPLTPIYIIFLPLIIVTFKKLPTHIKLVVTYSLLSILVWHVTPRTGGGRFILVYLPALSILCAAIVDVIIKNKKRYGKLLPAFLVGIVIAASLITMGYRGMANKKYIPVVTGQEPKSEFLSNNLNFAYGDFYDVDGYFSTSIQSSDRVLLYGFHNLYYVNFPFTHESWVEKGDLFNYIATQNASLPERFSDWQQIYRNEKTNVTVYTDRGRVWRY